MDKAMLGPDQLFFSITELKSLGDNYYAIAKLVEDGKLRKLNRTYYENT